MSRTELIETTEGPVNVVIESVNPKNWDGANYVLFLRHAKDLHIAFAWDGYTRLIDGMRVFNWYTRNPRGRAAVGAEIKDFRDGKYHA